MSAGSVVVTAYSIVATFRHPNHLTNVRSSVEAITLSLKEARLVKALHAVEAKYHGRPLSLVDALRDLAGFTDPPPDIPWFQPPGAQVNHQRSKLASIAVPSPSGVPSCNVSSVVDHGSRKRCLYDYLQL